MPGGRPQLKINEVGSDKRRVHVEQMDFQKLEDCYKSVTGDGLKSVWDITGKLCSKAVSEILTLFISMASGEGEEDEKKKKRKVDADSPQEPPAALSILQRLAVSPLFHHAVVLCGVNSYKELRKCDPVLAEVLPAYQEVWKEKVKYSADVLLPMMDIHQLGLELDPQKMMCHAVDVFGLWDEKLVTFRFHYDAAKVGVTVFGFSVVHPSVPSDSNYAFFPVAVYKGPENAFFLRQQAPKCVKLLEDYASKWIDGKNGGFMPLKASAKLRYQLFLNPDMKALTDGTAIEGCLVCPMTWQDVRAAPEPMESSLNEYYAAYDMEGKVDVDIASDESVYVYGKKNGVGTFVVHKTFEPAVKKRRMIAPRLLPSRLFSDLLEKVGDSLAVRVGMLVPDYQLHGCKRLVEKMIRGALVVLWVSDLPYNEKIEKVADCVERVKEWITQTSDLNVSTWLDDKNSGAGQVRLMSRDAKEMMPHLEEIMEILSLEDKVEEFKNVGRSLKEFFNCLQTGPSKEEFESGEYLKKLDEKCLAAIVARHTLFGAENDGLYEHMMHMVVEWEEMLISRGVCFRLFSMQAAEAYNQRLTRDLQERTQNHPLLTVGRVKRAEEKAKKKIEESVAAKMEQWKKKERQEKKEKLLELTVVELRREAMKLGVSGYTSMRKDLLIATCLSRLDDIEKHNATYTALRRDQGMFDKAVRGWSLFQAICNEFALKRYLKLERAKGRGETNTNVWTSEKTEERLRGLLEIGEKRMEEVKESKKSTEKRQRQRKTSDVDAFSTGEVGKASQKAKKKQKGKRVKKNLFG